MTHHTAYGLPWEDIGTAPKDGSWVIVKLPGGEVFRACWTLFGNPGWHVASDIGFVNAKYWLNPINAARAAGKEAV